MADNPASSQAYMNVPGRMSKQGFRLLGDFIQEQYGIKMPPHKKIMLESRLLKRLRHLGLTSYDDYCRYVFTKEGAAAELTNMIDVVTTNKTDFFRERDHFDFLAQSILPEMTARFDPSAEHKLLVWSAGCSTGEEAYTIGLVASEFAARHPGFDFTVVGTDVSSRALKHAKTGIYEDERAGPVPRHLREKYFMRSKDRSKTCVRIVPELRAKIHFRSLNLMNSEFGFGKKVHIIFCRNVMIYFERPTQERLLHGLYKQLAPGGYLILGHSETLSSLSLPLTYVAPTIYQRPA